jgi:pyridoxal phosphate enzyme (YggS family)
MVTIGVNLQAVRARIERAARAAGRAPESVELIAASKTFPARHIRDAHAAGQIAFGENYVQEGVEKITQLGDLPLAWHFIGPIQSNKTAAIAAHFQWVHGVEREKIARRLNDARRADQRPLDVCVQVNVSGEDSKSGVEPDALEPLAAAVARFQRLKLRGLMAIPEATSDVTLARRRYARLRELKEALAARGYALDVLSMGMSDDLEAAIAEGATMVRVGTAIFGKREQ